MSKILTQIHISDFFALKEMENKSYNYQYLNGNYYNELAYAICMWIVAENISSNVKLDVDSMEIGQEIQFKNEFYRFKGKDEGTDRYRMETINEKFKYENFLTREELEAEGSLVVKVKRRKITSARQKYAEFLQIEQASWTSEKSIILLMERKYIDELLSTNVIIGNVKYTFDQVCSSSYLKSGMEFVSLPKMNSIEKPMVLFSSNPQAIVDYLDNNDAEVKEHTVFVLGDKWLKSSQVSNLFNLEDACREYQIPIKVYSSVPMVMDWIALEFIESLTYEYCWLEPSEVNNYHFHYHFVENNREFESAIKEINHILSDIKTRPHLKYLDKMLKMFLKMNYSLTTGKSKILENQLMDVLGYTEKKSIENFDEISDILINIYENRFGYDVKKKIEEVRHKNSKCVLVVMDEMLLEISDQYKSDKNLSVISYGIVITEDFYNQFDQVILLSPYALERRKWLSSYICKQTDIIVPRIQEEYLMYCLKKEKKLLSKLYDLDYFGHKIDSSVYLDSINQYLTNNKKKVISEPELEIYNNLEIIEKEDMVQSISKSENYIEDYDTSIVDVSLQLNLKSGNAIMTTNYGKLFVVEKDGKIKRVAATSIKVNQEILEISIPYSDEFYRQRLKKIDRIERNTEDYFNKNIDIFEYYDYIWKRKFISFINDNNLNTKQLKESLEILGFPKKSLPFYKNWSSFETIQIVPQNREFIKFIGLMIGDVDLINNYEQYAVASESVKRRLTATRERYITNIEGNYLENIVLDPTITGCVTDKVVQIHQVSMKGIPRGLTNRFIRRDSVEYSE